MDAASRLLLVRRDGRHPSCPLSATRRVLDVVGSRRPSPYHFRARIQSFQGVAAPFPGETVLPSASPTGAASPTLRPLRRAREAEHSGDRARPWDVRPRARSVARPRRSATAALTRSTPRLAGGGLDMRRRDFRESLATADSRHRRSNEENSTIPDFQKQNLASFEGRSPQWAWPRPDERADAATLASPLRRDMSSFDRWVLPLVAAWLSAPAIDARRELSPALNSGRGRYR